jgi:O-antigen/teichoic acid export membrane protein
VGSLYAEPIMTFFYSDKYHGYGILVSLLIVKTMIESVSTPMTSALHALERPNITNAALIFGAAISLLFGYLLIKNFSLTGAGLAAVLTSAGSALWKWVALRRISDVKSTNQVNGPTVSSSNPDV